MERLQMKLAGLWMWSLYGVTLFIMVLASLYPSARLWGFNWYGYFSWHGIVLLPVVGVAVPLVLSRWKVFRAPPSDPENGKPYWPAAVAVIFALMTSYVLLSARTHFLGDGYLLLSRLETGAVPIRPWNMGAYFLVESVYSLVGGRGESQAELAFRLVSWLSGLVYLGATALTAAKLYASRRERLLFFGGVGSAGCTLLFFGYVENYPPLVVLVAGVTFLGLLVFSGRVSKWWLLLPLGLALLVHPFAVALIPATLFVLFQDSPVGRWYGTLRRRTLLLLWAVVLISGLVILVWGYQSSFFLRFSLLPVLANEFTVEGYTLFSLKHLLDIVNLSFMLVPGILFLIPVLFASKPQAVFRAPQYVFLVLLLVPSLLIVFLFDPKLGMPRDWDMFAFAGVPLAVTLYYALLDVRIDVKGYAPIAGLSILLGFLVLIPRAATQYAPDVSISVFDSYLNLDVVKNMSGEFTLLKYLEKNNRRDEIPARAEQDNRRFSYLATTLEGENLLRRGEIDQAEEKFRQVIRTAPNYWLPWLRLGNCQVQRERWDSALVYFRITDGLNPFNGDTYNSLGFTYSKLGELERALEYGREALRLRPTNFNARANLVNYNLEQGQKNQAVRLIEEAMELDSIPGQFFYWSADKLLKLGESDAAAEVCRRALEKGIDSNMVRQLEADYPRFKYFPTNP